MVRCFDYFTADDYQAWMITKAPRAHAPLIGFFDEFGRIVLHLLQNEHNRCALQGMTKLFEHLCRKDRTDSRSLHARTACSVLANCIGRESPIEAWSQSGFEDISGVRASG
jgi:hypothetical protein